MKKWAEGILIAAVVIFITLVFIGMYSTWSDCSAAGGTTVRGLIGLECINQKTPNDGGSAHE